MHQKDKILSLPLLIEVVDSEWDNYEVGSSFVIEEPFSAPNIDFTKYRDSRIYWDANKKGKNKYDSNRSRDGRSSSREYAEKIQTIHLGRKRRPSNKSQCIAEVQN